jgi:membrane protease YdiL (CAAX protease family)
MNMDKKQKIAIAMPILLVVFTYPVFQLAATAFGNQMIGWYLGLLIYWVIWCIAFPLWIIGGESIQNLIRPQKLDKIVLLLVILPLLMAFIFKFVSGMEYGRASTWTLLLLLSITFGNGFFEEVLWRGVYLKLFPDNILYRMIWPNFCFAIWHYAPGSVSPNNNLMSLMVGAGLFGLYLSYLVKRTNTIWWSMVSHTLGGIIVIL